MTSAELGFYVYGLVGRGQLGAAPTLAGIDDAPVALLNEGEICALVSRVSLDQFDEQPLREHLADMDWVERTARRHQQVLDALLDQCTPLPMRLCTVYGDEQALRALLEDQQDELSAALAELSGKLEWGVQLFASARPAEREPAADGAATGTSYLQAKLAQRRAGERAEADLDTLCEHVHSELHAVALASRLGSPQRPEVSARHAPMIMNGSYLVPNERREAFRARVGELHAEHASQGLTLQLTGPWPPYNFVMVASAGARS